VEKGRLEPFVFCHRTQSSELRAPPLDQLIRSFGSFVHGSPRKARHLDTLVFFILYGSNTHHLPGPRLHSSATREVIDIAIAFFAHLSQGANS
jgi:hypothetical protein